MKILAVVVLGLVFSGCSVLRENADKASSKVADGLDTYCEELDQVSRAEFRTMVNSKSQHEIVVTCEGDE